MHSETSDRQRLLFLQLLMAAVAKGRVFGVFALTKPYSFIFFRSIFHAFEWQDGFSILLNSHCFMLSVTKRLCFTQAAGTPGIGLSSD
jgi:hypothetical protein